MKALDKKSAKGAKVKLALKKKELSKKENMEKKLKAEKDKVYILVLESLSVNGRMQ